MRLGIRLQAVLIAEEIVMANLVDRRLTSAVLMAFFWCASTAPSLGQKDPPKEVKAPRDAKLQAAVEKIIKAFDEIEIELQQREKMAESGQGLIATYRTELEEEYVANATVLKEQNGVDEKSLADLTQRQKTISLYLWELQRIEPMVMSGSDNGQNALNMKIHRVVSQNSRARREPEVMERFQALNDRISRLSRNAHQRMRALNRGQSGFHIIVPDGGEVVGEFGPAGEPDSIVSGPIQKVRQPVQRILKLSWSGGSLDWDRDHWGEFFHGKTLDKVAEEVAKQLKDRGLQMPRGNGEQQRMVQMMRHQASGQQSNLNLLFQNLQYHANEVFGNGGRHSGSGGANWRSSFDTGQLRAGVTVSGGGVEFEMRETEGPERSLRVSHGGRFGLRISLQGERIIYFDQRPDGRVRIMDIYHDEELFAAGESFAEVYAKNPALIEVSLFPTLRDLGFILPPTRYDPPVVERVLEKLRIEDAGTKTRFAELLVRMDSASFATRDEATRELQQDLSLYLPSVNAAYRDKSHSLEVRARLRRILQAYGQKAHSLDRFVTDMGMVNDAKYLVNLMPKLTEKQLPIVSQRLEKLSGMDFGEDVQKWQEWLGDGKQD